MSSARLAKTHGGTVRKLMKEGAPVETIYHRARLAAHYAREVLNGVS